MRIIALEEFLRVLEDDLGERDITREKIRALVKELAEDEQQVFSLEELRDLLARGSPIGFYESDALELLIKAFRGGPLGQRIEKEVEEELQSAEELSLEDIINDILVLLERGSSGELTPAEAELYAALKDLIHEEAEELFSKLLEKSEDALNKWGLFSLDKVVELLERGVPVGAKESDALELLEKVFREGPLGRRFKEELREYTDFGGLTAEDVLALLERGSPIGYDESDLLAAVQKAGFHRR